MSYRMPFGKQEPGRYQLPREDLAPPPNGDHCNQALSENGRFATVLTAKTLYVLRLPVLEGSAKTER